MRVKITLACQECKQRNYNTTKNKKNDPDRIELSKYCRFCKKHTAHKETKQSKGVNGLSAEANVKKGIGTSLRETRTELKKVHWPSRKELTNYTWIVIFSVFIVSLIIYLIDSGLGFIIEKVVSL